AAGVQAMACGPPCVVQAGWTGAIRSQAARAGPPRLLRRRVRSGRSVRPRRTRDPRTSRSLARSVQPATDGSVLRVARCADSARRFVHRAGQCPVSRALFEIADIALTALGTCLKSGEVMRPGIAERGAPW